jgi:hypothetical protein
MTDRVVIVCRNSMLLGGRVSNSTRPLIWGGTRPTTASRRPAPRDGIWVYIAHADRLDRVTPDSLPGAPQWRIARKMRAGEARFVAISVVADVFTRAFGHYVGSVSDEAVEAAVKLLRDRWMSRLYVVWNVLRSVPSDRLPCQWQQEYAPVPKFLFPKTMDHDDWS